MASVTQFCKLALQKGKTLLSIPLARLKRWAGPARERLRGWPRFWQIGALYLLVLLLAGGIYLWRTSQLRTINPYGEKINFGELPDRDLPGGTPGGEEADEWNEPAAASPAEPGQITAGEEAPEPALAWPVRGGVLIFDYGSSAVEALACLEGAVRWSFCQGLGIAAAPGEAVHSVGRGRVKGINEMGKPYGKEIIVEQEDELTVYYGALERVEVKVGDPVVPGKLLATVKDNPRGEEAYLYLEMLKDGRAIDPLAILPRP